ncbi:MAG: DUF3179 domain-containing protein [Nitrosopumilus sp. H8]|nr:MAG: DUF3179 domain-containing protein [Nitrosopumilus sp. H8]
MAVITVAAVLYALDGIPAAPADQAATTAGKIDAAPADQKIMTTDGVKHSIPLEKIRGGGPPKDGIPSIDRPVFASADAQFVSDSDTVIGLDINGEARAYPLFILVWHEIVNDEVGGVPVSVTYCPLCYTNQVFKRVIDGQTVEFGTSGKLYNSNLLMYDRLTESYWSQALGEAVKGELTGRSLELVPFDVITWGDWKTMYPDTLVLTTETGHVRSYATDPYGDYYTEPRLFFPVEHRDDRLHQKEIIIGFHLGDVYKAYRQADIEAESVINDSVGGVPLVLASMYEQNMRVFERTVDGKILDFDDTGGAMVDSQTGSEWNYDGLAVSGDYIGEQLRRMPIQPGFWFEWVAFHPGTQLYGGS